MGAGVSSWRLAGEVARRGALGVVSGTGLDTIFARRLGLGDLEGNIRRALDHFPNRAMARRVLDRFFVPGGKQPGEKFRPVEMFSIEPPARLVEVGIVANFVEVFLAKEGHDGPVGVNFLEKIQLPALASLYGALLAGVGYVIMGAGIPREIPGVLDRLARHESASLKIDVLGASAEDSFRMEFDPLSVMGWTKGECPELRRPKFLGIVSGATLALTLARKSTGRVDGFIVEGPTAGGHNAPPRGPRNLSSSGEPIYGRKDEIDIEEIRKIGLPFWLAGGWGSREKLAEARSRHGAVGIQVGTAFAFCHESGLDESIKKEVLERVASGTVSVLTDPDASPTSFPFKVASLPDTLSESETYLARTRRCDLGYLRKAYRKEDGSVGYRCAAEPESIYVAKGGEIEDTAGRKCLCNALLANIGLGQVVESGAVELPLVTAGDDLSSLARFFQGDRRDYSAADVLGELLG